VAPAAPRLINRGDLLAALDGAAARKVTIISAPAGSGKCRNANRMFPPSRFSACSIAWNACREYGHS
jgi:ATP/maltotriose-dependent transcriptional regulator MalT